MKKRKKKDRGVAGLAERGIGKENNLFRLHMINSKILWRATKIQVDRKRRKR
jgi:hypothetical protein